MPTLLATTKRLDEVGSAVSTPSAITNTVTLADGSGNLERLTWQDLVVALGARAAADLANVQLAYTESGKIPSSLLNLTGFEFQGDYNAGTNSPALADTDTGKVNHLYRVTNSGNPTSKDFGSGSINISDDEYVAYSGASGSGAWINIGTGPKEEIATGGTGATTASGARTNLDVMSTGDVNDRSNSKGPIAGVNLGANGYLAPGSAYPGTNPLQDNYTALITVRINKLVSHSPYIAMLTPGGAGSSSSHGSIHVNSNGTLDATHYDGNFDNLNDFLGGSVELGRAYRIAYRVSSGDEGLSVFVDGVKKGTVATGPGVGTTLRWNLGVSNTDNSNIEILGFTCFNRALSDSELAVESVRQLPEVADQWGGAATYTSDFSGGVDGWSNINGSALDGNIDSIGGQNDNLRYTVGSSTGEKGVQLGGGWPMGNKRYQLTFDIYVPSANAALDGYRIKHSVDGELKSQTLTADTWTSVTLDHYSTASGNLKIISQAAGAEGYTGNGSDVFYLRNLKVTGLGAVVALLPNNVLESGDWQDASTNRLNGIGTNTTALIPNRATYERKDVNDLAAKSTGNGLFFDTTNDYLNLGNQAALNMGANQDFTVCGTAYFADNPGGSQYRGLFSKRAGNDGYNVQIMPSGRLFAYLDTSSGSIGTPDDGPPLAGKIFNFAVVFDRDGTITRYVNGDQYGSTVDISSVASGTVTNSASATVGYAEGSSYWRGEIRNLTVFNRALSATDVSRMASTGVPEASDKWGGVATYTSDFTSTTDGFSGVGATLTANYDSGDAGHADTLRIVSADGTADRAQRGVSAETGQRYRLTCNVKMVAGSSGRITCAGVELEANISSTSWVSKSFEFVSTNTDHLRFFSSNSGSASDEMLVDGVVFTPIGSVVNLAPTPGSIESDGTWLDSSSNQLIGAAIGSPTPLITIPSQRGTFTPTLSFAGNSAGITYSEQLGNWERVGERAIMINGRITLTSKGSNPPHLAHYQGWIHGLPFTSINANNSSLFTVTGVNLAGLTSGVVGMVYGGNTYMKFMHFGSTGEVVLDYDNFTNSTTLLFSGTYITD